jgi:hypothetical protein
MESLAVLAATRPGLGDSLTQLGVHPVPQEPFYFNGRQIGWEYWRVEAPSTSVPSVVRGAVTQVTVEVAYTYGSMADTARYTRFFGR